MQLQSKTIETLDMNASSNSSLWLMECAGTETYFYSRYSLLKAAISIFPSLMSSLMNLFVLSSSISWHVMRSLKSGLSRKESVNSSVGSPMVPEFSSHTSDSSTSLWAFLTSLRWIPAAWPPLQTFAAPPLPPMLWELGPLIKAVVVWLLLVRLGGFFFFFTNKELVKGESSVYGKQMTTLFLYFDGVTFRIIILTTETGCVIINYPRIWVPRVWINTLDKKKKT